GRKLDEFPALQRAISSFRNPVATWRDSRSMDGVAVGKPMPVVSSSRFPMSSLGDRTFTLLIAGFNPGPHYNKSRGTRRLQLEGFNAEVQVISDHHQLQPSYAIAQRP